ncbi:thioesterase II family protein [Streptomyces sp. NPDC057445]|uniref:thioesterase II family protein n=1 Tax=Streptomyces sp. NPDC057445 TaxID=3346136 RepID=UPI00369BE10D
MTTTSPVRPWLLTGPPTPGAPPPGALRLYCFPHAGGNPAEYLRWAARLPGVELHAVQLPGRGIRHQEPDATDIDALVADFLADVALTGRYAFFGHSLGALIAYEITRALRDAGRHLPEGLVVSAFPAPHLPRPATRLHTLSDDLLLRAVARRHGGIPPEILESRHMRAVVAAPLRADLRLAETYRHRSGVPLPVPLTVFAGDHDRMTESDLAAWQDHTTEPVTVRTFLGGHFYFRDDDTHVLPSLNEVLGVARGTQTHRPQNVQVSTVGALTCSEEGEEEHAGCPG